MRCTLQYRRNCCAFKSMDRITCFLPYSNVHTSTNTHTEAHTRKYIDTHSHTQAHIHTNTHNFASRSLYVALHVAQPRVVPPQCQFQVWIKEEGDGKGL